MTILTQDGSAAQDFHIEEAEAEEEVEEEAEEEAEEEYHLQPQEEETQTTEATAQS